MKFEIVGKDFVRDGKPVKLISGAVHYFRNMPDTWADIFKKLRACGCNCVETYCAWNAHEKQPGVFDFNKNLDIAKFIGMAGEAGLMVIVRPGPYICSEWDFGGLPWWLQREQGLEIRCMNSVYIRYFNRYLDRICDKIRPLLATNGGPVIMVQCENEYGSYGDDKEYLAYLRDGFRARGIDVPLFTSDGGDAHYLLDGTVDGVLSTVNFGSRVKENFAVHDVLFPNSPKMCMEMWDGWFDAWGDEVHHTTDAETYARIAEEMLEKGSLNMYMFIGGTNFGFTAGANHYEKYTPDVTSYDYDAPLTECGDVTEKYLALRKVFARYAEGPLPEIPENRTKKAFGKVELSEKAGFFANLEKISSPVPSEVPHCMEDYGFGFGYIAYRTVLNRKYEDATLSFESIGDRAQVFVNGRHVGTVFVNDGEYALKFSADAGDVMTVLVENMGRTNYGPKMMRKKGIVGRCLINGKLHFHWDVFPLPMEDFSALEYTGGEEQTAFYRGVFDIDAPADTFLRLDGFTKGFAVLNGFNLGRHWRIGPQRTLYVPASLLNRGRNELIVFESEGLCGDAVAEFTDTPDLGPVR